MGLWMGVVMRRKSASSSRYDREGRDTWEHEDDWTLSGVPASEPRPNQHSQYETTAVRYGR